MSDPREKLQRIVPATLTKRGEALVGEFSSTGKAKGIKSKQLHRAQWDDALAQHVATMADGDSVDVEVIVNLAESGKLTARLVGVASLATIRYDAKRSAAVQEGGFINPYTFVPTLPRGDQNGTRLAGTGLDDKMPPSHAYHTDGQWSGHLNLTLTTVTPLLLPVPAAEQPEGGPRTFDVRKDRNKRPLIHGASLKGALRSAYETVTASRYGVFFEHHDQLAYRVPANAALDLTPARVYRNDDGTHHFFRLCRGDTDWTRHDERGNKVQYAAWVPAYKGQSVHRLGSLAQGQLTDHHGSEVHARVVLHQYNNGNTRFQVWRATHLARTAAELNGPLSPAPNSSGRLTPVSGVEPRVVRGWLSATGYSISTKHDERLFVETHLDDIPVTSEHQRHWQSVLRAYDLAQGYNDPNATYARDTTTKSEAVVRSLHVPSTKELRGLPDGTLVYVKYDGPSKEITQVHPVMIGRLPFAAAPGKLLHETLRPADNRDQLSPADRLFGWVPPGRRDDDADSNDGASGYRGRLRIRSITCVTDNWEPPDFPPEGVTLAPLSSPKPTQFRFYASSDPQGMPMERGAKKAEGYTTVGGLRGRKMYRWREENAEYWEPPRDEADPARDYLAMREHRGKPKQLVRHRGWVRPGVTFQVELFLDGVPEAELGALLWLLTRAARSDDAPLRIGAGKPYGFGVVTAEIDTGRTRLWDAAGVRAGWLRLSRPAPAGADRLTELAETFAATAQGNDVLREATESYLRAARSVTEQVHYPRKTREPQAESYQWFVENEKLHLNGRGWSLPHVREDEQRLPYLDEPGSSPGGRRGRDTDKRQGPGRSGSARKGRRDHRQS